MDRGRRRVPPHVGPVDPAQNSAGRPEASSSNLRESGEPLGGVSQEIPKTLEREAAPRGEAGDAAPRGAKGGGLARRALARVTHRVRQAPVGPRGNAVARSVSTSRERRSGRPGAARAVQGILAGSEAGNQTLREQDAESRKRSSRPENPKRTRARAPRDRHERRRLDLSRARSLPKGAGVAKPRASTVGDIEDVHVRDERWAPVTAHIRSSTRASSRMGIGARQPHRDSDVRGRKRREGRGMGIVLRDFAQTRRCIGPLRRDDAGSQTMRSAEVGRVKPFAVRRCPRASVERAHGRMNVWVTPRPCVTECAGRLVRQSA